MGVSRGGGIAPTVKMAESLEDRVTGPGIYH